MMLFSQKLALKSSITQQMAMGPARVLSSYPTLRSKGGRDAYIPDVNSSHSFSTLSHGSRVFGDSKVSRVFNPSPIRSLSPSSLPTHARINCSVAARNYSQKRPDWLLGDSTRNNDTLNTDNSLSSNVSSHQRSGVLPFAAALSALVASLLLYYQLSSGECSKENLFHATVFADNRSDSLDVDEAIKREPPIYRICLTGGPSSGKTSSMAYLRDKLSALGFQVFVVTEMATLLLSGGASYRPDMDLDELLAFESALMKNQMAVEDNYIEIARASKRPTVILCDRGVLDAKAYMSQEIFESILDIHGWNENKLREGRYDAVIHMITAAIGAEKFYTKENNPSRMETAEEAAKLDHIIRQSYIGHPNYKIIDNSTNFEGKVERVYSYVGTIVGLPKNISTKRKYLLKRNISDEEFPPFVKFEVHEMTQNFLKEKDANAQTRIRKRSQKATHTYSMTTKKVSYDGKEETVSVRPITAKSYYELCGIVDPSLPPIKKVIRSFVYGENYFELATYMLYDKEEKNPVILQVESGSSDVEIPKFLEGIIDRDVTPERETEDFYGSYYFSVQKGAEKHQGL